MKIAEAGYTLCDSCHVETPNGELSAGVCKWCRRVPDPYRCRHGKVVSPDICRRFHLGEEMKGDA